MASVRKWLPRRSLSAALNTLKHAQLVAFGGVGFAGQILPVTEAYYKVRGAGAAARPKIEQLLSDATPAGKVYAAKLLSAIDPTAGRAAWQRLANQSDPFRMMQGCIASQSTLADYAANELDQDAPAQ